MSDSIKIIILILSLCLGYPLIIGGVIIGVLEWEILGVNGRAILLGLTLVSIGTYTYYQLKDD